MDSIPCLGCSEFFIPRNRSQEYCSKPECQKARKALWQKEKIKKDPEYKETQKLSNQKWLLNNSDYWKNYRKKNPEKALRNRMLQRIRNRWREGIPDRTPHRVVFSQSRVSSCHDVLLRQRFPCLSSRYAMKNSRLKG